MNKSRFTSYPSDRPRFIYEYYVTGQGNFPFDMLRYDAAWPASGEDAFNLDRSPAVPVRATLRSVRLRSYSEPTIERWSSFGWSVGTEKL